MEEACIALSSSCAFYLVVELDTDISFAYMQKNESIC